MTVRDRDGESVEGSGAGDRRCGGCSRVMEAVLHVSAAVGEGEAAGDNGELCRGVTESASD